ncbi:MAG TPA: type IV pilus modification protein PilV [Steroidobacteraceae bacterium]|nr:type IV pilus modification protein PilV [Steroidobacteraceae bacterium]
MQLIRRNRSNGFSLVEVLVALVVTAIGLLGIAKIQALAYASTGTASARALVAIQAAGLASAMHANRNYWSLGLAPSPLTITGTAISDNTLNVTATGKTDCWLGGAGPAPCVPATLAAFDLHTWANALSAMMPNGNPVTVITCPPGAQPLNCTIVITWNEKAVALNTQAAANTTAATFSPSYTLYVEP